MRGRCYHDRYYKRAAATDASIIDPALSSSNPAHRVSRRYDFFQVDVGTVLEEQLRNGDESSSEDAFGMTPQLHEDLHVR